ncbi:hypothetical protein FN846DRAFT_238328 [Sphaerosporella brunnea]|uniref:Uncharacterized protein n=1 Tax=Sphaerosporella brunnea TaxID=1250544 RepID=A0A5J5FBW2_9PEZI|nr:hypothetical protein FN846DRAFT_238328 [Sphaerosporella brunnea]
MLMRRPGLFDVPAYFLVQTVSKPAGSDVGISTVRAQHRSHMSLLHAELFDFEPQNEASVTTKLDRRWNSMKSEFRSACPQRRRLETHLIRRTVPDALAAECGKLPKLQIRHILQVPRSFFLLFRPEGAPVAISPCYQRNRRNGHSLLFGHRHSQHHRNLYPFKALQELHRLDKHHAIRLSHIRPTRQTYPRVSRPAARSPPRHRYSATLHTQPRASRNLHPLPSLPRVQYLRHALPALPKGALVWMAVSLQKLRL